MKDKLIEQEVTKLGSSRQFLLDRLSELDYNSMNYMNTENAINNQIMNIDSRIDTLISKLENNNPNN